MAESQKRDCFSVSVKEKDVLQDLEIGKDFLNSWKSVSMAEGNVLDFDLTPVSKGNKKLFDFDKADMDFNLDGDFGKISSFNMDVSDLDISPPLKKDGKSKEKSKESSGRKDKGKTDCFAFAFDFDKLENFSFDSSLTKESLKAQKDKKNKESSPNGGDHRDKEDTMHMNVIGSTCSLDDGPPKPSLQETRITFDMHCLVGGSADLEPTRKTCPSNLAMDDAVTAEHSAAINEVATDEAKSPPETTVVSRELPNNRQSKKLVTTGPVDLEACTGHDTVLDLSSDSLCDNEPSGGNSSEAHKKADSVDTNVTGSNGEQDANMISGAGSTCHYKHKVSENSQHVQTVTISKNITNEKSQDGVEDHVIDDRGRTELGQVNSLVENSCTTSAVSGIICDTPSSKENQEPASGILKLPLVSQPAELLEKQTENGREPLVNCSRPFIRPEKPECLLLKASTQTTFSSLSSMKMGFAQPSLVEGRRDVDTIQSDKKLVSIPLQCYKTLLRGELPQARSQESSNGLKTCGEVGSADGLQSRKKLNDSSTTQIKEMVKTKSAMRQREMSMKDLDSLSMEINKEAAKSSENPTIVASIPTIKDTPVEEHRLPSTEGGRKAPNLPGLKLSGLSLDSTNSPIRKDSKSARNSNQKSILFRKTPSDIAYSPSTLKNTPSTLSMKRTLEDHSANIIALHPSKRLFQSATTSRNSVETSEKVVNKKVPSRNHKEDDCIKSTIGSCEVTSFHSPHEVNNKEVEISFSIQNDSNIKLADAYSKELDDLCNILRKKHDEAKEILVQAIVNSNKLLMLNNPWFEEKHSTAFMDEIISQSNYFLYEGEPGISMGINNLRKLSICINNLRKLSLPS